MAEYKFKNEKRRIREGLKELASSDAPNFIKNKAFDYGEQIANRNNVPRELYSEAGTFLKENDRYLNHAN